jgi:nicotinamidase-related amidase
MQNTALKAQLNLSQLIMIDMQLRLATVMPTDAMQSVLKNCSILAQAATLLEVPVTLTEQYPKGLGHTLPELSALLPKVQAVEKITFSCLAEPKFERHLTRDHSQIMIAGMEAHICVLQTALDLVASGKQVFVVEDAVISRNPANKVNAINRMREAGCIISNTESVLFEWLGKAEGDIFKTVSKLIR